MLLDAVRALPFARGPLSLPVGGTLDRTSVSWSMRGLGQVG